MSNPETTAQDPSAADPLSAVADAMQQAASSVQEGATAARDAAEKALPSIGMFANRFLYTSCYAVSYGVVFPMALVALSVPQNNPLVHGMISAPSSSYVLYAKTSSQAVCALAMPKANATARTTRTKIRPPAVQLLCRLFMSDPPES